MLLLDVQGQQQQILQKIYQEEEVTEATSVMVLLQALKYSKEELECLGSFGQTLKWLAENLDLLHPDLPNIFNQIFIRESQTILDLMRISQLAYQENLCEKVCQSIRQIPIDLGLKNIVMEFGSMTNIRCLRFISDESIRTDIRSKKWSSGLSFNLEFDSKQLSWDLYPASFASYIRHENPFMQEIDQAKKTQSHLERLGLTEMSGEVKKSIHSLESSIKTNQYFGFNRITTMDAAYILAKMHGGVLEEWNGTRSIMGNFTLKKDQLWNGTSITEKDQSVEVEKTIYRPTIFPLIPQHNALFRDPVQNLLMYLEQFPSCSNKPLFDHYWGLVPHPNDGEYASVGIILGQRDEEMYFIGYIL